MFAALGDEERLRLLARLCAEGPLPIVRLSEGATVTRQAVTKHLNALARAGVLYSRRSGRERIWQVRPQKLHGARQYLEQISEQWAGALSRLQAFVEADE